ncbi:uncharacterized protein LOC127258611 [Andrographis paniculata]|uniref:uncharacterized protein LOC127258611 n=1 Tax=Andrographis paniculata TaxID=175694 RepID=UPI0021E7AF25|nr:uncharacterized protein LOC127258611 [Andrographis paniculata]
MSWLARSIANTLKFDDDNDEETYTDKKSQTKQPENPESPNADSESSPRGVKEDLSEISKTLTRQFWGVASFLAPPPPQPEQKPDPDASETEDGSILGIRGDFAEIGGKFRSGISRLSNNINVSEITKMASNFLQLESDDESGERGRSVGLGEAAIGVTEEVVAFARDVSMHPETWLDFPLPEDFENDEDFDMSDAQQEHALAVERLAPGLAALRFELCPRYMSESNFWKIYFVLLHPRLDKEDAVLLSTPQVLEARALLTHDLKNRKTIKSEDISGKDSLIPQETSIPHHDEPLSVPSPVSYDDKHENSSNLNPSSSTMAATSDIGKHETDTDEIETVDKSVISEKDNNGHVKSDLPGASENKDEDDTDDWLNEEVGTVVGKNIPIDNDDDVSFSDLEEDDGDVPSSYRKSNYSSDKDSRDWVQLGKSSPDSSKDTDVKHSDEENAWLDVNDIVVS